MSVEVLYSPCAETVTPMFLSPRALLLTSSAHALPAPNATNHIGRSGFPAALRSRSIRTGSSGAALDDGTEHVGMRQIGRGVTFHQQGILGDDLEAVFACPVHRPQDIAQSIGVGVVELDIRETLPFAPQELLAQVLVPSRPGRVDLAFAILLGGIRCVQIRTVFAGALLVEQVAALLAPSPSPFSGRAATNMFIATRLEHRYGRLRSVSPASIRSHVDSIFEPACIRQGGFRLCPRSR